MSLSKFIPSKFIVDGCIRYGMQPCVIFESDLPGKKAQFGTHAAEMCREIMAETGQMGPTKENLLRYDIIVAIGDVGIIKEFLVMRRLSANVYETHYEAIRGSDGTCLFDLAAEAALYDAACRVEEAASSPLHYYCGCDWISKAVASADAYVSAMMSVGEVKLITRVTIGEKANAMEHFLWKAYTIEAETRVTYERKYTRTVKPDRKRVGEEAIAALHRDKGRWPSAHQHRRAGTAVAAPEIDFEAAMARLGFD
jgi:hypothetical protein